jgi:hypothetical protein
MYFQPDTARRKIQWPTSVSDHVVSAENGFYLMCVTRAGKPHAVLPVEKKSIDVGAKSGTRKMKPTLKQYI